MDWLGLDIGGAHIKLADGTGLARAVAFELWKEPQNLSLRLRRLWADLPAARHLAVTMTGELADCFRTRAEGVQHILQAVNGAATARTAVRVYLTDGRLVSTDAAMQQPWLAAAANWHALARFAARFAHRDPVVLIDVGSTTCDVIPLVDGRCVARGTTDTQRLVHGELVYTGVTRSPLCAIVHEVPYGKGHCPVAQEFFATIRDVYLTLGDLPEAPRDTNTADGRPATRTAARSRLARSICADVDEFDDDDARRVARAVADAQLRRLAGGARRVLARLPGVPATFVVSGQGEFLARRLLEQEEFTSQAAVVSLSDRLGPDISRCATAHALAVLALEMEAG